MTPPGGTRVLMTTDAVGGIWTYACELGRALESRDIHVALAVMGGAVPDEKRAMAARVPGLQLFESDFALEWMDDPWEDLERAGRWLRSLADRVEPDLVHLNGYVHAALEWDVPVVVVAHSCVLSWWEAVRGDAPPSRLDRYRAAVRRGLDTADAVVAPTAAHLRAMERQYGSIDGRVIPNGRRPDEYRPGRKRAFGLVVGRLWDPAKNVRAVARLAPDLPWPVYAAGARRPPGDEDDGTTGGASADAGSPGAEPPVPPDGPSGAPRPPEAAGGSPGFHPLGDLGPTELGAWYGAASVFVLPARYEPFGLAPLEAGLAGCPLVLGDIETLREVWGRAATFAPPEDEDALRRALRRLMEDPERRGEMASRARRRALGLRADAMGRAYAHLYDRLVDGGASRPPEGARERSPGAGERSPGIRRPGRAEGRPP